MSWLPILPTQTCLSSKSSLLTIIRSQTILYFQKMTSKNALCSLKHGTHVEEPIVVPGMVPGAMNASELTEIAL